MYGDEIERWQPMLSDPSRWFLQWSQVGRFEGRHAKDTDREAAGPHLKCDEPSRVFASGEAQRLAAIICFVMVTAGCILGIARGVSMGVCRVL